MLLDVQFAVRMIRNNPWFSAAVALTLAFGIGLNTTVFSLVNAVLFKPLAFAGGDRLVTIANADSSNGRNDIRLSYPDFKEYRANQRTFESLEAMQPMGAAISEKNNPPQRYPGARVTTGMFRMLHTSPVVGRDFAASDELPSAERTAILGYGVWKDRYGKDPSVIGRVVRINDDPVTIIGVMPEGFKFPNNEDLWVAMIPSAALEQRSNRGLLVIGIRKEDVSIAQALSDFSSTTQRLAAEFPQTNKNLSIRIRTFHETFNGGPIRVLFLLMMGAVAFVLLIACANVANMLLARSLGRTREISIRTALGASRWRVVRQLLIESIMLSCLGGFLGLVLTSVGVRAFAQAVSDVGKPYWIDFSVDYTVFAYFACITVISGVIFGLVPALQSSKIDLNTALKDGARNSTGGARGGHLSGALVVVQFSLALVLLTGAGLLVRTLLSHQNAFGTMPVNRLLTGRLSLGDAKYGKVEQKLQFAHELLMRLAAMPGVESVSIATNPPGSGFEGWRFEVDGQPAESAEKLPSAGGVVVGPGYFGTIGVNLLQGRDFVASDGLPGKEAAIVSQRLANRFFPAGDGIGKRIRLYQQGKPEKWLTITGVIPEIKQNAVSQPDDDPLIFVPYRQNPRGGFAIVLRTVPAPSTMVNTLRREVQGIDAELPLFGVESLVKTHDRTRWAWKVFGTVFSIFAVIALAMAAMGIYAVIAHTTSRRTQEIGIRIALGARMENILRLVIGRGLIQITIGLVLGLGVAFGVTRFMKTILEVSPTDPLTFGVVTVVLTAAGVLACYLPARRAAKMDPLRALRYE